jgi:hypothetical protein
MAHDQQSIEQPERDRRNHEKVHRGDAVSMVAKEGLPSLRGRGPPPRHVLGYTGLADIDAELEEFTMDSRRSHKGLAILVSRISRRISNDTIGRPQRRRDFQRQYNLKPARCQRITVSGRTITKALSTLGPVLN